MTTKDINLLIQQHQNGQKEYLDQIFNALYKEIKAIAGHQLKSLNPGDTITPTALANECYLKMVQLNQIPNTDKRHFMQYLSKCMRSFLIDAIRAKQSIKRQGEMAVTQITHFVGDEDVNIRMIDIEQILETVEAVDLRLAEVLQYKLLFSLTYREIGLLLGLSERQTIRLWKQAKTLMLTLMESTHDEN